MCFSDSASEATIDEEADVASDDDSELESKWGIIQAGRRPTRRSARAKKTQIRYNYYGELRWLFLSCETQLI